jgi:hypothetical protein
VIAIIPCGGKKLAYPAPAGRMYAGNYHRACYSFAMSHGPAAVYILSALYGLLPLDQVISPYSLRMGQPGCVTADRVREDAQRLGIAGEVPLILGGEEYRKVLRQVFVVVVDPLAQVAGGIGYQIQWMNSHRGLPFHA